MASDRRQVELEQKVENLQDEIVTFMGTLKIVAGDNERLSRRLKKVTEENQWLSEMVINHEKRISELEDMFIIEN